LNNLVASSLRVDGIKTEWVEHMLVLMSLIKPGTLPQASTTTDLSQNLQNLIRELKQSPATIRNLVEQIFQAPDKSDANKPGERFLQDISQFLRNDLLQQSEQTLHQLLTQKASLRLQQEQQQPIQINLSLPLQIDNQSRPLHLRIREKQRNKQEDEQHWEMDLSFEFGQLGMISTHILLQANRLSAHFWARKVETKQLIDSQLEKFKQQLSRRGFEPGLFNCYHGEAPTPEKANQLAYFDNLVDIQV
jgi:hypothetical protein